MGLRLVIVCHFIWTKYWQPYFSNITFTKLLNTYIPGNTWCCWRISSVVYGNQGYQFLVEIQPISPIFPVSVVGEIQISVRKIIYYSSKFKNIKVKVWSKNEILNSKNEIVNPDGNWSGACVNITLHAVVLCISHVTYLVKHFWRRLLCYQVHVPFRHLYGSMLRTISNMLSRCFCRHKMLCWNF
jgi:hypothetical protein